MLLWLMEICHIRETSSTIPQFNPHQAMFRDGERSVMLEILKFMPERWEPEKFMSDLSESAKVMSDYFPEEEPVNA